MNLVEVKKTKAEKKVKLSKSKAHLSHLRRTLSPESFSAYLDKYKLRKKKKK